jgi:hypothetical protein
LAGPEMNGLSFCDGTVIFLQNARGVR